MNIHTTHTGWDEGMGPATGGPAVAVPEKLGWMVASTMLRGSGPEEVPCRGRSLKVRTQDVRGRT